MEKFISKIRKCMRHESEERQIPLFKLHPYFVLNQSILLNNNDQLCLFSLMGRYTFNDRTALLIKNQ